MGTQITQIGTDGFGCSLKLTEEGVHRLYGLTQMRCVVSWSSRRMGTQITQITQIMQIGTDCLFADAHRGRGPQITQIGTDGLGCSLKLTTDGNADCADYADWHRFAVR